MAHFLVDEHKIECGPNFAYVLQDNSCFLSTEYKVLQNQSEDVFVKCMRMSYNGKTELYYNLKNYKSLSLMISQVDDERFITIIGNIFSNIISVKNNGFLAENNIDSSFEHIYIDPTNYKVGLVYLPLNKHEYDDGSLFENALRTNLVRLILTMRKSSEKMKQISANLQDGAVTLEDLRTIISGKQLKPQPMTQVSSEHSYGGNLSDRIKLVAIDSSNKVEFVINKNDFSIGKKDTNDGIVGFNKMISRTHCKITNRNGLYAVTDLQSANGTFVNGAKLEAGRPYPIKNGDIIRLANIDFQVVGQ